MLAEITIEFAHEVACRQFSCHADGVGESARIGPPMTLDNDAIQAEERSAVDRTRIKALTHPLQ